MPLRKRAPSLSRAALHGSTRQKRRDGGRWTVDGGRWTEDGDGVPPRTAPELAAWDIPDRRAGLHASRQRRGSAVTGHQEQRAPAGPWPPKEGPDRRTSGDISSWRGSAETRPLKFRFRFKLRLRLRLKFRLGLLPSGLGLRARNGVVGPGNGPGGVRGGLRRASRAPAPRRPPSPPSVIRRAWRQGGHLQAANR